jgi:SAM-dependent methyltransferase
VKLYISYANNEKEGFERKSPNEIYAIEANSVDEISAVGVLETVCTLTRFIEACYKILKPGGKAEFTAPYHTSNTAWADPCTIRGISELSLNFSSAQWRKDNKYPVELDCDFAVACNFAISQEVTLRSEEVKNFWLQKYNNVVHAIVFTLTKKEE